VAKQNPELVENCYKVVIANHLDEIQRGGETFFVEASGSAGTHVDVNEKRKATEVLNKDQLDMCAKWGVDPEDYLRELTAGGSTAYVS
jgi:hypothetical protein